MAMGTISFALVIHGSLKVYYCDTNIEPEALVRENFEIKAHFDSVWKSFTYCLGFDSCPTQRPRNLKNNIMFPFPPF